MRGVEMTYSGSLVYEWIDDGPPPPDVDRLRTAFLNEEEMPFKNEFIPPDMRVRVVAISDEALKWGVSRFTASLMGNACIRT